MVAKKVTVTNAMGLHMRPAQLLARAVAPFDCCVEKSSAAEGRQMRAAS